MQTLGRYLQIAAMLLLPVAMLAQIFGGLKVWQLLVALVGGVAIFYLGRMIEGYSAGEVSPKTPSRKKDVSKK